MEGKNFPNDVMYYYQISKAATMSGNSNYYKENHISQMGRLNYTYDDRYLLTLTARRDGYSAFGESSKFGVFPSAAIGWNISNESFFKDKPISETISNLKYRLSWGKNGNEAISAYSTLPNLSTYNYLNDDHTAQFGFYPSKLASPGLGWETTTSINTGFDIALWNGRIQSSFDIYWSKTKDLLLSRSIPTINGTGSITENRGQTRNRGFEFQITSNNITHKSFSWSTSFNLSHYRSEIVDVGLYDANGKPVDDVASKWFIGEPLRVIYDYNVIGIWQYDDPQYVKKEVNGNIIEGFFNEQGEEIQAGALPGSAKLEDVNKDGKISAADKKVIGSRTPSFLLSMGNRFQYKNISFSFLLNGTFGQWKERHDLNNERWGFIWNNISGKEYWTENNHNDQYTALDYMPYDKHSFYSKVNYVTIKNISLDYHLEKQWIKALGISDASINISVNNLYTFSNIDNAVNMDADNMFVTYPTNRSYMFGLNINF